MDFNRDFYWHDSVIQSIEIDRRNPGEIDTIKIVIDWYDNGISAIIFEDVRWASLNMNFGVVAQESILTAYELNQDDVDLQNLYASWKPEIDNIKFSVYRIETNSTASIIKIIAKGFRIEKV